jgi:DNA-binding transcriptional LysR family regulator
MLDQLRALAVFARVADLGSFREAARVLELSPSVVSHHVRELETRVATPLLHRTTRRLALTPAGERLVAHARDMVEAAERGLGGVTTATGRLRVTAPAFLAATELCHDLAAFSRQHPQVDLVISFSETPQDLLGSGLDVAFRIGALRDSTHRTRKLADMRRVLVAAPGALDTKLRTPRDLAAQRFIQLKTRPPVVVLAKPGHKSVSVSVSPKISVDSAAAIRELALAGAGIATLPELLVRDDVQRGRLMIAAELPDRELLASEIATLGVKAAPDVLAAAPSTTPQQHAARHVAAWLANIGLRYDFEEVIKLAVPEARAYLDHVALGLGDVACTKTPLSAGDTSALTAWAHRQDEHLRDLAIAASACGPYAWVSWSIPDDGNRREVLLARDGPTRILGFKWDLVGMMPGGPAEFFHTEAFFAHGDAIVGIVLQAQNLWIVAGGKVVTQSKGDVNLYDYDERSQEVSRDIVSDSGTLWHATPTGREKLDLALIRDHEPLRRARDIVRISAPSADPKYVAALSLLGADPVLVAEVKALVP